MGLVANIKPKNRVTQPDPLQRTIRAIQSHYMADMPPPFRVIVPPEKIHSDRTDRSFAFAQVTIDVETANYIIKSHTVTIRFRLDKQFKVIPSSITYPFYP